MLKYGILEWGACILKYGKFVKFLSTETEWCEYVKILTIKLRWFILKYDTGIQIVTERLQIKNI